MAESTLADQLAQTLRHTFGDLLDLPVLEARKNKLNGAATSPASLLARYAEGIRFCQDCSLHIGRQQLVFGRGDWRAKIAFVGDFPSDTDDKNAEPFFAAPGSPGELLNKMILAMKLRPEEVYITNIFKCRPPHGEQPGRHHWDACEKHLAFQLSQLQATMVVALGDTAARSLARSESGLSVLRRQTFEYFGRKVICTHHPRDLLENPVKKRETWDDLQRAQRELGQG